MEIWFWIDAFATLFVFGIGIGTIIFDKNTITGIIIILCAIRLICK
jgi:hypothetical protein